MGKYSKTLTVTVIKKKRTSRRGKRQKKGDMEKGRILEKSDSIGSDLISINPRVTITYQHRAKVGMRSKISNLTLPKSKDTKPI